MHNNTKQGMNMLIGWAHALEEKIAAMGLQVYGRQDEMFGEISQLNMTTVTKLNQLMTVIKQYESQMVGKFSEISRKDNELT